MCFFADSRKLLSCLFVSLCFFSSFCVNFRIDVCDYWFVCCESLVLLLFASVGSDDLYS